jgi:hypothetical protein
MYSAVSAALALDSKEPASGQSHSVKSTNSAEFICGVAGLASQSMRTSATLQQIDWVNPLNSSAAASRANPTAPRRAAETTPSISGPSSCEWSETSDRIGYLLRTSLESDMTELTECPVTLRTQATPSGRSISILRYRRDNVAGFASSGWPTPTETANHDAPSMRKWPAYARYQDAVKRTTVRLWEWMMDFPVGWLDCMSSETRLLPQSQNSSAEQS